MYRLSVLLFLAKRSIDMKESQKNYEEVAKRCSSYKRNDCDSFTNSATSDCTSCLNCSHFSTEQQHCNLDLYDQIIKTL